MDLSSLGNINTSSLGSNLNTTNLGNITGGTNNSAFNLSSLGGSGSGGSALIDINNSGFDASKLGLDNQSGTNSTSSTAISDFMAKLQPIIDEFMAKLKPILDQFMASMRSGGGISNIGGNNTTSNPTSLSNKVPITTHASLPDTIS